MSDVLLRHQWVARVLGVQVGETADDPAVDRQAIRDAYERLNDGYERVGRQISGLQDRLRGSDDADLQRIAEFGLNALTGGLRVKLQAACMPLIAGSSPDAAADARKVGQLAGQFAKLLIVDAKIGAFDNNPFGVEVAIAETLRPLLRELAVAAAA